MIINWAGYLQLSGEGEDQALLSGGGENHSKKCHALLKLVRLTVLTDGGITLKMSDNENVRSSPNQCFSGSNVTVKAE